MAALESGLGEEDVGLSASLRGRRGVASGSECAPKSGGFDGVGAIPVSTQIIPGSAEIIPD